MAKLFGIRYFILDGEPDNLFQEVVLESNSLQTIVNLLVLESQMVPNALAYSSIPVHEWLAKIAMLYIPQNQER